MRTAPKILAGNMAELVEIPGLDDVDLVELAVCGQLHVRGPKAIAKLKKLEKGLTSEVADLGDDVVLYIQLFSGGPIKNHLHVNMLFRGSDWPGSQDLVPVEQV